MEEHNPGVDRNAPGLGHLGEDIMLFEDTVRDRPDAAIALRFGVKKTVPSSGK